MGNLFSSRKSPKIVLLGLDQAGKTAILYRMKGGKQYTPIPTVGFNVETAEYQGFQMTCWDVGGDEKIRALWRHYYAKTDAVVWVVDSTDRDRLNESKEELFGSLGDQIHRLDAKLFLFLANKQDSENPMTIEEIAKGLDLHSLDEKIQWSILPCSGKTGIGVHEGLEWLHSALQGNPAPPQFHAMNIKGAK